MQVRRGTLDPVQVPTKQRVGISFSGVRPAGDGGALTPMAANLPAFPKGMAPVHFGISLTGPNGILATAVNQTNFRDLNKRISFDAFYTKVLEKPQIVQSASQRVLDAILSEGTTKVNRDGNIYFSYNAFSSPINPSKRIAGMIVPLHNLVQVLRGAAAELGLEKRLILLAGPVGSAKTTAVEALQDLLKKYTKSEAGELYRTHWKLEDKDGKPLFEDIPGEVTCETNDDPFNLIPNEPNDEGKRPRSEIVETLLNPKLKSDAGGRPKYLLSCNGEPCIKCGDIRNRLLKKYDGNLEKVLQHVEAERFYLDADTRTGIAVAELKDEKSEKASDYTGEASLKGWVKTGKDSDPQVMNLDGALPMSNRGVFFADEGLKRTVDALNLLLTAAQSRKFQAGKSALNTVDNVLMMATNEPDYAKLLANLSAEALKSRIYPVIFNYNERINDEMQVYAGEMKKAKALGIHESPYLLRTLAEWAVTTRLIVPPGKISVFQKALAYNGEYTDSMTEAEVQQLKLDATKEQKNGRAELMTGVSPRTVQNALARSIVDASVTNEEDGTRCVDPFLALQMVRAEMERPIGNVSSTEKEEALELLDSLKTEVKRKFHEDYTGALAGDEKRLKVIFEAYKANLTAKYEKQSKILNPHTGKPEDVDEKLLSQVERKFDVTPARADDFRQEFLRQVTKLALHQKEATYENMVAVTPRWKKALSAVAVEQSGTTLRMPMKGVARDAADKDLLAQWDTIKNRLVDNFGYCSHCAELVLSTVSSNEDPGSKN